MKYYYPFITIREPATLQRGILQMFNDVLRGYDLLVYTDSVDAEKTVASWLVDDDDAGVLVIDTESCGFVKAYNFYEPDYSIGFPLELLDHLDIRGEL